MELTHAGFSVTSIYRDRPDEMQCHQTQRSETEYRMGREHYRADKLDRQPGSGCIGDNTEPKYDQVPGLQVTLQPLAPDADGIQHQRNSEQDDCIE